MPATILSRVINSVTDNRVVLASGQFVRPVTLPSTWDKIRLAMRYTYTRLDTSITQLWSNPFGAFGFCKGSTTMILDNSTDCFFGWTSFGGITTNTNNYNINLLQSGTTYINIAGQQSAGNAAGSYWTKKEGTTYTNVIYNQNGGRYMYPIASAVADLRHFMFFIDIQKGSPNYSCTSTAILSSGTPQISLSGGYELSQSDFLYQAELEYPSYSNHTTTPNVGVLAAPTQTLDSVCVAWNRYVWKLEITDLAVVIFR